MLFSTELEKKKDLLKNIRGYNKNSKESSRIRRILENIFDLLK